MTRNKQCICIDSTLSTDYYKWDDDKNVYVKSTQFNQEPRYEYGIIGGKKGSNKIIAYKEMELDSGS